MADSLVTPLFAFPGGWELVLIVAVVVLLFGAAKLPDLARNSGRALRIFKSETKGLMSDDDDDDAARAGRERDGSAQARPELEPPSPHGDPLREEPLRGERRDG